MAKKSDKKVGSLYGALCSPAKFYLVISLVSLLLIVIQNIGSPGKLCLGSYSCTSNHVPAFVIGNAIYIMFWTWILDIICKGSPSLSWIVVLLPFIAMFIMMALILFTGMQSDNKNRSSSQSGAGKPFSTKVSPGELAGMCPSCTSNLQEGACWSCGYSSTPGYGGVGQSTQSIGMIWPPSAW